ncbi:conjugal transfer protein TraD [Candidatus Odyssella acanthamoebae]|nr:conjugal transfer protein TraD [Candidatus Paracaedibacter acanthamoebae]
MNNRSGLAANGFRKARTRTLIQLGGLIEKAGLLDAIGLIPGSDLQKDPLKQPLALSLLGALLEIKQDLQTDQVSLEMWKLKAQEFLNEGNKILGDFSREDEKG